MLWNGYGVVHWPGRKPLILWWAKNMMLINSGVHSLHHLSSLTKIWSSHLALFTLHTSVADQINMSMTYPPTKYDQDMNIFLFIHVRMFTLDSNTCMKFKSLFKNTWTLPCTNLPPNLFGEFAEHTWVIHISAMIIYTQYCICTQVLE